MHHLLASAFALVAVAASATQALPADPGGEEPHVQLPTPVTILQRKLNNGEVRLESDTVHGYLVSLLRELHVPISSQVLVFSKTSLQRDLITPRTPRAIYFTDDVYVAWVPGSKVIELSDVHPTGGPRFYTLSQSAPANFTGREDCARCHDGLKTLGVPGYLMGSNFTGPDGQPFFAVDSYRGGHRSPLAARWGGWYVTGTHAGETHLGNSFLIDKAHPETFDATAGANVTDLRNAFDQPRYLSPHSDLVALLVLEHQVRMHNLISRLHRDAQDASAELPAQRSSEEAAAARRERIAQGAEALLEYLLFRDEAPLKGPVQGTSSFTVEFQRAGPWDRKGRSLRQFDLQHRLLRFPCSYLIYSAAFDALPLDVKTCLWQRLAQILRGQDRSSTYASMAPEDREAVFEILQDTKPEFQAWLRSGKGSRAVDLRASMTHDESARPASRIGR